MITKDEPGTRLMTAPNPQLGKSTSLFASSQAGTGFMAQPQTISQPGSFLTPILPASSKGSIFPPANPSSSGASATAGSWNSKMTTSITITSPEGSTAQTGLFQPGAAPSAATGFFPGSSSSQSSFFQSQPTNPTNPTTGVLFPSMPIP